MKFKRTRSKLRGKLNIAVEWVSLRIGEVSGSNTGSVILQNGLDSDAGHCVELVHCSVLQGYITKVS